MVCTLRMPKVHLAEEHVNNTKNTSTTHDTSNPINVVFFFLGLSISIHISPLSIPYACHFCQIY